MEQRRKGKNVEQKTENMLLNDTVISILQEENVKRHMEKMKAYDVETYRHCINVAYTVTKIIPPLVQQKLLDKPYIKNLITAALLHDIGKITVPISVLHKTEPLSKKDLAYIHQHPLNGVDLLSENGFPEMIYDVVLKHHEKLDGSGYPCGYAKGEISNNARIISVADIYCALSEKRCYKKALSMEQIFVIMNEDVKKNLIDSEVFDILRFGMKKDYEDSISCHLQL